MNEYSETEKILGSFPAIGLEYMDRVKLMDRIDTKYVLSAGKLPEVLHQMAGSYKSLEINNIRSLPYQTRYFDTRDLLMYNQHVTSRPERFKIRFRTYLATETTFLEVKKHTRRNRTIKWRIENHFSPLSMIDKQAESFLESHIPETFSGLEFSLANSFSRVTLAGTDSNERITVDFDLKYTNENGKSENMPWLAIIEHKRNRSLAGSKLSEILKSQMIRPVGFSKYCIGVSLLNENARKNTLKEKFLLIDKIENEYNRCSNE